MSWLTFNTDTSKVEIAPEAMAFDKVQAVYKKDRRNENKPYFNKVITYTYHAYARDHKALGHLFPSERKKRVCNHFFAGEDVTIIEKDEAVNEFVKFYIKDSGSIAENFYEGLKKDMEKTLEHINNIPMVRKQRIKKKVEVQWQDDDANSHTAEVWVDTMIEIDNSDEKLSAIKRADTIIDLEGKMKQKIIMERKERKKNTDRLFDK